jgi:hypothetical protein
MRIVNYQIYLMLFIMTVTQPLLYAGPNSKGIYMGIGMGVTHYAAGEFCDDAYEARDSDSDWAESKVYIGLQFNEIIALEFGSTEYGTFYVKEQGEDHDRIEYHEVMSYDVSANAGYSFFDGQFRPYGKLGVSDVIWIVHEAGAKARERDESIAMLVGVGIQYEPNVLQGIGIRLGYELAHLPYTDIFDLDYSYFMSESAITYLALQYKF